MSISYIHFNTMRISWDINLQSNEVKVSIFRLWIGAKQILRIDCVCLYFSQLLKYSRETIQFLSTWVYICSWWGYHVVKSAIFFVVSFRSVPSFCFWYEWAACFFNFGIWLFLFMFLFLLTYWDFMRKPYGSILNLDHIQYKMLVF